VPDLGETDVANGALVGMAALVQADRQTDWAREIILGARCQREVAINALARDVADQLVSAIRSSRNRLKRCRT
jgi:hypothetical protein